MPTYEYICSKCNETFDLFQSIRDKPITICPEDRCQQKKWGKGKVRRAIGAGAGLIFKGSGFYTTDYRSDKYKEAAKKDSPSPAPSGDGKSASAKKESTSSTPAAEKKSP
ncbi:MAG: zinc ribbon domain-containing protein [Verrucomicrobia bacterium]|nr:zinc ribbon domain-containing protein [Verrucomicrobiota bacterium]